MLYHGTLGKYASDIICNGIILSKSKQHLDFGPGFYTTPNKEFALETANRRARAYNAFNRDKPETAKVLVFECDDDLLSSLNIKQFIAPDNKWADFIIANRCSNSLVHMEYDNNLCGRYDIVSGPTADGRGILTPTIELINTGELSITDVDRSLIAPAKNKIWGTQLSFHTVESLSCLQQKCVL